MPSPSSDSLAAERWRPQRHFAAARGFINDPNGLIVVDGRHHAFYQHNPHAIVHGSMHWGHAVSDDLVNWQELPIALYPNEHGQCFSGCAVTKPEGGIALFYTAHLERKGAYPLQTQCLVHADPTLTQFEGDSGNPVLSNIHALQDYRDPKVFWHSQTQAWIMLITLGRHVGIYRSNDLSSWIFASEFGHDLGAPGDGAWECPDLVEVPVSSGGKRWVLIVGVWSGAPGGGSGTQYFLGDFDGYHYWHDEHSADVYWFDHGRDCYAAQSFAGREGLSPRVIAWCGNWQYADQTPTTAFRGTFTLPRDLDLVKTAIGYRLRQSIPPTVTEAFPLLDTTHMNESDIGAPGPVYRIHYATRLALGESLEIYLFGEPIAIFVIERPSLSHRWHLRLYRDSKLCDGRELTPFGSADVVELAEPSDDELTLDLYVDHGITELLLCGGVEVATMAFYPANPAGSVRLLKGRCR